MPQLQPVNVYQLRIVSGEDRILTWTNIVYLPDIQFPRPEATVAFDVDPAQATTRPHIMVELLHMPFDQME